MYMHKKQQFSPRNYGNAPFWFWFVQGCFDISLCSEGSTHSRSSYFLLARSFSRPKFLIREEFCRKKEVKIGRDYQNFKRTIVKWEGFILIWKMYLASFRGLPIFPWPCCNQQLASILLRGGGGGGYLTHLYTGVCVPYFWVWNFIWKSHFGSRIFITKTSHYSGLVFFYRLPFLGFDFVKRHW